jgi:predicted AAA+ superfamily ATPase
MLRRWLEALIEDTALGSQMRFVAGPRQCGKTTLARSILGSHDSAQLLFNGDIPAVRRRYREDSLFYRGLVGERRGPWVCFDEIHKQHRLEQRSQGHLRRRR